MNLPKRDLPVYEMLFIEAYEIETHKETLANFIKHFKSSIEKLQKCEIKELDGISAKKLLKWLETNYKHLHREKADLSEYRKLKKSAIEVCKNLQNSIKKKTDEIPEIIDYLSFPDEYKKFKKALPDMIKYKKEKQRGVFYRGNFTKQFLKWYNKLIEVKS